MSIQKAFEQSLAEYDKQAVADPIGEQVLTEMFALHMEYRLHLAWLATQGDQKCFDYFVTRRHVVLPQIAYEHTRTPNSPDMDTVFHNYAKGVHKRLCGDS